MSEIASIEQLNQHYAIPDSLRFEPGKGGLAAAIVDNPACSGQVYLHGAHVGGFKPTGHDPVLFMSTRSFFEPGKAIRGGVPICFPWFGPHPTDTSAPSHGPARITPWRVEQTTREGDGTVIVLASAFDPFAVRLIVRFGSTLSMTLNVQNNGQEPTTFEAALHTYLSVADVKRVEISGLESTPYIDKVGGQAHGQQGNEPIRFVGETDRVYLNTQSACVLTDPGLGRRITVDKAGSDSTVVWNPWIDKAKAMNDLGDDDWQQMVCVETANAGPNAVTLGPGLSHEINATISVERM